MVFPPDVEQKIRGCDDSRVRSCWVTVRNAEEGLAVACKAHTAELRHSPSVLDSTSDSFTADTLVSL